MSTYEPAKLLALWKLDQIDSQMVIGHLLQNLVQQQETIRKLTTALRTVQEEVERLAAAVGLTGSANLKAK